MNRRQYLSYTGLGAVTATAGCLGSDDDGDSEPADGDATDGDDADSANGESAKTPPEFEDGPLELGDGIVFYTDPGDAEISFTPFEASLSSVIVDEANSRPVVETPDTELVLTMLVEVSNTGDETVDVPGDVAVEVDGERYRHLMNTGAGDEYDQYSSLEPDERIVRTLAFDIPDVDAPDRLTTTWEARDLTGTLLSSTAEWELEPDAVTQPGERIDGLAVGDVLEVRDQRTRYELTVTAIETDRGDDGRTAVTLDIENLGPSTIEDPIHNGLALVADDEPVERLDGDDPFEPVPLDRGESDRVELAFEGDSAEHRRFELQLTPYATAVWESTR